MPFAIEELFALIAMDCSVAAVTVSPKLFDVIPFCVAVTLLEPMVAPVAKPAALMLTAAGFEDAQVAVLVRLCVLPSLNVPVALTWTPVPLAIEELLALMVIDCRVAAVTARAKLFEVIPFWDALILLDPVAAPVARPLAVMLTVVGFELAQAAEFVRF